MTCSDEQFCRIHHIGELFRIEFRQGYLVGDADVESLRETVEQIIETEAQANVIVDMSNVERISSDVLGELINSNKKLVDSNGQMRLAGVLPQIDQMIEMLQLDQVIELQPTVSDAVDSFGP